MLVAVPGLTLPPRGRARLPALLCSPAAHQLSCCCPPWDPRRPPRRPAHRAGVLGLCFPLPALPQTAGSACVNRRTWKPVP